MREFAKKISSRLQPSDYKGLYSKQGVIDLMKGYGYTLKENDINDGNWEEIYSMLTHYKLDINRNKKRSLNLI